MVKLISRISILILIFLISKATLVYAENAYTVEEFSSSLKLEELKAPPGSIEINTDLGKLTFLDKAGQKEIDFKKIILQAFKITSEVLRKFNFPEELLKKNYNWRIIVTRRLSRGDSRIVNNYCHLAQMGPPADIVFDASNFSKPCIKDLPLNLQILSSLIHEAAHVIEYHLMAKAYPRRERWHSEGFALWFQSEAISLLHNKKLESYFGSQQLAAELQGIKAKAWSVYTFSGSREDYLHSYNIIKYLIQERGIAELLEIYNLMNKENLSFSEVIEKRYSKSINQFILLPYR